MSKYAYSCDNEHFNVDLEGAVEDACNGGDFKSGDTITIYRGQRIQAKHSQFFTASSLIEDMQNVAMDNYNEWSEDYLTDISKEKTEELDSLIVDWFENNADKPSFYCVENVVETKHVLD